MELTEITYKESRRPEWVINLLPLVVVIWGFVGIYLLQLTIDSFSRRASERVVQELAYFPSGLALRESSIEYDELFADFIWLTAIDYYGRHLETDRRYEWLGHIFEILTTLDPRFIGAYRFGAMTLAWDARKPMEALALLFFGMKANPLSWQLPFDAGFINYMLLGDYKSAAELFQIAAKLPDAWRMVTRWVPYLYAKSGDFETAKQMWSDLYYSTQNRRLRELILRQLRWLKFEEGVSKIKEAVARFADKEHRLPASLEELIQRGYLERVPEEPYGGRYYLKGGEVHTTTPPSKRGG